MRFRRAALPPVFLEEKEVRPLKASWRRKTASGIFCTILVRRLLTDVLELPEARWLAVLHSEWVSLFLMTALFVFLVWESILEYRGGRAGILVWSGLAVFFLTILAAEIGSMLGLLSRSRLWLVIPGIAAGIVLAALGDRMHRKAQVKQAQD